MNDMYIPSPPGFVMFWLCLEFLEFWIASIRTYASGGEDGFPKIILIGTHRDELPVSISLNHILCVNTKHHMHDTCSNFL